MTVKHKPDKACIDLRTMHRKCRLSDLRTLDATVCQIRQNCWKKKRGGDEPGLPNLRDAKQVHLTGLVKQNSYDLMTSSDCLQIIVSDSLH